MKVSKETVKQNRERVIDTTAKLLRERGIDGIGVADLMKAAGMTHGGFYRQFESKDDLVVQAVTRAFKDMSEDIAKHISTSADPLQALVRHYVSDYHRDQPGNGCSLAALATDASRHDDPNLRGLFDEIVSSYIGLLINLVPDHDAAPRRGTAIAALSEMIGAVVLSRAVRDPALSGEILETVSDDLVRRHAKSKSQ